MRDAIAHLSGAYHAHGANVGHLAPAITLLFCAKPIV